MSIVHKIFVNIILNVFVKVVFHEGILGFINKGL